MIPAHNEEALIGSTLTALRAAIDTVGEPYEIIVVDDDSTDRTAAVAAAHGARVVHVTLRQIAAVRNAGAAAAAGGVLIFVDADTIVPAATVGDVMKATAAGAVAGGASSRLDPHAPFWAKAGWLPFQFAAPTLRLPGGAFMFVTRAAFDAVGGFDERYFAGEEIYLARALKKVGPFRMVRPAVITSGRKFRLLGFGGTLRIWLTLARHGMVALKDRKHLGFWYDKHRD
ncbi:MAG: glycosyltransferase [Vicinamibacterales bacterium]